MPETGFGKIVPQCEVAHTWVGQSRSRITGVQSQLQARLFAADLSDGLAAAMASIGTGIGLAIWFGWPIVVRGAGVLLSLPLALDLS